MSANDQLTEREHDILNATAKNGRQKAVDKDTTRVHARRHAIVRSQQTPSETEAVREELAEVRRSLAEERQFKRELVAKVKRLQDVIENDGELIGGTTLEKYSLMDEEDREDLLAKSEQRAVKIYDNWDDLAWTAGHMGSERLMETKARANAKHQPSKIKYRLEQFFDREFGWNEIYRMMKAVARLSGGEEEVGEYGRTKIVGGDFEFEVTATADGSDTRRVLREAD